LKNDKGENVIKYKYEEGPTKNLELFLEAISRNNFGNPEIRQRLLLTAQDILRIKNEDINDTKMLFVNNAIAELKQQMIETPLESRIPYTLGVFYVNIQEYEKAEEMLKHAIELSPKKQEIRRPLIQMYLRTNEIEKALDLAKETYELDTTKDDLWVEYVAVLSALNKDESNVLIDEAISSGDTDKVERLLLRGINLHPDNTQTYVSLAAFYNQIGEKEKALKTIDDTIEKFPQYANQILPFKKQIEAETAAE
jgi:tetratricopeptide (TPR) repeat protein